jgi:RNA binding exosome subunit
MFNHVVKNYIDIYKTGKIITIHDALICTTEEKDKIIEIINRVFLSNYNIAVNIKVKQLGG